MREFMNTSLGRVVSGMLLVFLAAYPLLVFFVLNDYGLRTAVLILVVALLMRFMILGLDRDRFFKALLVVAIGATVCIALDSEKILKLYPTVVSGIFAASFGITLYAPPSAVERMAVKFGVQVNHAASAYMRRVTIVWCVFFVINGLIAAWLALNSSLYWWSLYSGLLSYLLMAVLFGVEYLVRLCVIRKHRLQRS